MPSRPVDRSGFTLLEVVLAVAISALLLAALYVAIDLQLRNARAGRNIVEQATLARALMARVEADISATGTLIDPERFRTPANSSSSSSTSSSSTSGLSSSTSISSSNSSSSSSSTGSSSSNSSQSTDAIILPLSVQGDSSTLNLFLARVPREAIPTDPNAMPQTVSDLRRVSWWMTDDGLARQEVNVETSEDALYNLPPGLPGEEDYVLAPEVKSLQFQYFDGTNWQDSWDCTTLGEDGVTPIGPPQAIRITMEIATSGSGNDKDSRKKRYRHVVACVTANGTTPQTQQQETGTGTGTGTGGTSP